MTTSEIEENVYTALINNQTIMDLLANADKSIFHTKAPEVYPALPVLVYSAISDVPNLHGDNKEFMHRVTVRIHIITGNFDYFPIFEEIQNLMESLGFTRLQTTPFVDEKNINMLIADFKIITGR